MGRYMTVCVDLIEEKRWGDDVRRVCGNLISNDREKGERTRLRVARIREVVTFD